MCRAGLYEALTWFFLESTDCNDVHAFSSALTDQRERVPMVHSLPFQCHRSQRRGCRTCACNKFCSTSHSHVPTWSLLRVLSCKRLVEGSRKVRRDRQRSIPTALKAGLVPHVSGDGDRLCLERGMATARTVRRFLTFEWHCNEEILGRCGISSATIPSGIYTFDACL